MALTIRHRAGEEILTAELEEEFVKEVPLLAQQPEDYIFADGRLVKLAASFAKWKRGVPLGLSGKEGLEMMALADEYDVESFYRELVVGGADLATYLFRLKLVGLDGEAYDEYRRELLATTGELHHDLAAQLGKHLPPSFTYRYTIGSLPRPAGLDMLFAEVDLVMPPPEQGWPRFDAKGVVCKYAGRYFVNGQVQPPDYQSSVGKEIKVELGDDRVTIGDREVMLPAGDWNLVDWTDSGTVLLYDNIGEALWKIREVEVQKVNTEVSNEVIDWVVEWDGGWVTPDESYYVAHDEVSIYIVGLQKDMTSSLSAPEGHHIQSVGRWLFTRDAEKQWYVSVLFMQQGESYTPVSALQPVPLKIKGWPEKMGPLYNMDEINDSKVQCDAVLTEVQRRQGLDLAIILERDTTRNSDLTMTDLLDQMETLLTTG